MSPGRHSGSAPRAQRMADPFTRGDVRALRRTASDREDGSSPAAVDRRRRYRGSLFVRKILFVGMLILWGQAFLLCMRQAWGWGSACSVAALILGLVMIVSASLAHRLVTVTVRGESMAPTYHDGDQVIVRRGQAPQVGQVVIVEQPDADHEWREPPLPTNAGAALVVQRNWMIKRVAATAGALVPRARIPALAKVSEEVVPQGKMVLLGDNRSASYDSRHVGYFPAERILGIIR
ncbi:S26 family signal peptidase [Sphaerisporangium sp. NPDC004334]